MKRKKKLPRMKKLKNTAFWASWKKSKIRNKIRSNRLVSVIMETKPFLIFRYRLLPHFYLFLIPWILLTSIFIVALLDFPWNLKGLSWLMLLFVLALLAKPMNVIHGLIGTRGNIQLFFLMFLFINFMISGVYYFGFFKNAGITYDVSQPHVEFGLFEKFDKDVEAIVVEEGHPVKIVYRVRGSQTNANLKKKSERIPLIDCDTAHFYHRINYKWVLQNTLTTSLMQEPTEFYAFACTYSGDHEEGDRNIEMANGFHWFLVFHILISWIFLGVFISLIYQKFRNN